MLKVRRIIGISKIVFSIFPGLKGLKKTKLKNPQTTIQENFEILQEIPNFSRSEVLICSAICEANSI